MFFCYRFPNLRLLDFRKIKQKERKDAIELFKSKKGKELLKEIAKRAKTITSGVNAIDNSAKGFLIHLIYFSYIYIYKYYD